MVRIPGQPLIAAITIALPRVGRIALGASAAGLARLGFLDHGDGVAMAAVTGSDHPHLRQAAAELRAWAAGGRDGFQVPLDLAGLPPFARRVLEELRRQPHGTTVSYGALAARCGSPRAARAVGGAMARNPLPIIIPCHRVVACAGIGGFSPGLAVKRLLWAVEGITR